MSKITHECETEQGYIRSAFRKKDNCNSEHKFSTSELG